MVLSAETIKKLSENVASYSIDEKIDYIQGHHPAISKESLDELTLLIGFTSGKTHDFNRGMKACKQTVSV